MVLESPMAEQARILVVDDEPAVQSALSRALTLERYEVAQAIDGREALERLADAAYEVVILDISMPYIDGSRCAAACATAATAHRC
jgi:CheY-like chemotaxis protein